MLTLKQINKLTNKAQPQQTPTTMEPQRMDPEAVLLAIEALHDTLSDLNTKPLPTDVSYCLEPSLYHDVVYLGSYHRHQVGVNNPIAYPLYGYQAVSGEGAAPSIVFSFIITDVGVLVINNYARTFLASVFEATKVVSNAID